MPEPHAGIEHRQLLTLRSGLQVPHVVLFRPDAAGCSTHLHSVSLSIRIFHELFVDGTDGLYGNKTKIVCPET